MVVKISEFQKKYPKLILRFEKETGCNAIWGNKLSGNFKYWLKSEVKYKDGFICDDPNCSDYGKKFPSKSSFSAHIRWHNKEYRERMSEKKNKLVKQKEVQNNHIFEFFLNFMDEHTYFSRRLLLETYADKINLYCDRSECEKEFKVLIKHFKSHEVISRYSRSNNKIDKGKLREYNANH